MDYRGADMQIENARFAQEFSHENKALIQHVQIAGLSQVFMPR